jgi:hypothetical protein
MQDGTRNALLILGIALVAAALTGLATFIASAKDIPFAWWALAASITDTVHQGEEGFEVSAEGVTFSLVGSDGLDEAVGHEAAIEGVAIGTLITVETVTIEE